MPELPEVETIARGVDRQARGQIIRAARVLTPSSVRAGNVAAIANARIHGVSRRAKLLLVHLDKAELVFHLKMTGRLWLAGPAQDPPIHTRLIFDLESKDRLIFEDTRRFGFCMLLRPEELAAWDFYASLGPEPLETSPEELARRFTGKARIKSLLLDQTVVAGIGNIYADESLFAARIHPESQASAIPAARLRQLCVELQRILREAIEAGGSTFRDYRNAYGKSGLFQERFLVYGKKGEPCPNCGRPLAAARVAGRTSTHCPHCQRRYAT